MYLCDIKMYEDLKEKGGIYYLSYDNEIIYIGQSKNLYNRLSAHYSWKSQLKQAQLKRDKGRRRIFSRAISIYRGAFRFC